MNDYEPFQMTEVEESSSGLGALRRRWGVARTHLVLRSGKLRAVHPRVGAKSNFARRKSPQSYFVNNSLAFNTRVREKSEQIRSTDACYCKATGALSNGDR